MDEWEFIRGQLGGKGRKKAILGNEDWLWKFTAFGNFVLFCFVLFTKPGLGLVVGFGLPSKQ